MPPSLIIVSLLIPPGPLCRVMTHGTAVVFTPIGTLVTSRHRYTRAGRLRPFFASFPGTGSDRNGLPT